MSRDDPEDEPVVVIVGGFSGQVGAALRVAAGDLCAGSFSSVVVGPHVEKRVSHVLRGSIETHLSVLVNHFS